MVQRDLIMGGGKFMQGDSQSIHAVCVVDPDETVIPPYILDNVQNTTIYT